MPPKDDSIAEILAGSYKLKQILALLHGSEVMRTMTSEPQRVAFYFAQKHANVCCGITAQERAESILDAHPYWIPAGVFVDTQKSAPLADKPALNELLELCATNPPTLICVNSITDFGRDADDFVLVLERLLATEPPLKIFFVTENLCMTTPYAAK